MPWEIIRIEDKYNRDARPFISISSARISFSASFVNDMMNLVYSGDKQAGPDGKFEVTQADRVNFEV